MKLQFGNSCLSLQQVYDSMHHITHNILSFHSVSRMGAKAIDSSNETTREEVVRRYEAGDAFPTSVVKGDES